MLALGLILVVLSALALIAALAGGSDDPATFDLGIFELQTNTMGVFLLGAGTVLLFVMGLELVRSGVRRANRRRREQRTLTKRSEELEAARSERHEDRPAPGSDTGEAPRSDDATHRQQPTVTKNDPE